MFKRKDSILSPAPSCKVLTGYYIIDPVRSTIGFSFRRTMINNVGGRFTAFEGLLNIDESHPSRSEAFFSVQSGSVDTGSPERDVHLTGPDFLDSADFPLMSFRSTRVLATGAENRFRLGGFLQVKDVELPLHIDLEFGGGYLTPAGQRGIGFAGTALLRRSVWGPDSSVPGGNLISDGVKVTFDISAVRVDQVVSG